MQPVIVNTLDTLIDHIKDRKPRIVTIDGRDGSGKTYLATQLARELGGTHLTEENYRSADYAGHFVPDTLALMRDIGLALSRQPPVIYDSCFMLWIMKRTGLTPDLAIYSKDISHVTDEWNDADELDEEATEKEAVTKALKYGALPFRTQMIEYHYRFKPHEAADIVYHNTGVGSAPEAAGL